MAENETQCIFSRLGALGRWEGTCADGCAAGSVRDGGCEQRAEPSGTASFVEALGGWHPVPSRLAPWQRRAEALSGASVPCVILPWRSRPSLILDPWTQSTASGPLICSVPTSEAGARVHWDAARGRPAGWALSKPRAWRPVGLCLWPPAPQEAALVICLRRMKAGSPGAPSSRMFQGGALALARALPSCRHRARRAGFSAFRTAPFPGREVGCPRGPASEESELPPWRSCSPAPPRPWHWRPVAPAGNRHERALESSRLLCQEMSRNTAFALLGLRRFEACFPCKEALGPVGGARRWRAACVPASSEGSTLRVPGSLATVWTQTRVGSRGDSKPVHEGHRLRPEDGPDRGVWL